MSQSSEFRGTTSSFQFDASAPSFVPGAMKQPVEPPSTQTAATAPVPPAPGAKAPSVHKPQGLERTLSWAGRCKVKPAAAPAPPSGATVAAAAAPPPTPKPSPPTTTTAPPPAAGAPESPKAAKGGPKEPMKRAQGKSLADLLRPPVTLTNLDKLSKDAAKDAAAKDAEKESAVETGKEAQKQKSTATERSRLVYAVTDMMAMKDLEHCKVLENRQGLPDWALKSSSGGADAPGSTRLGINSLMEFGRSNKSVDSSKYQMPAALTRKQPGSAAGSRDVDWSRKNLSRSRTAERTPTSSTNAPSFQVPELPEESWQVQQQKEKEDGERSVKVVRQLRAQLNKMTPKTYDSIFHAILEIGIRDLDEAAAVVKLIFEKAITNHQYLDMYADLCGSLEIELQKRGVVKVSDDEKASSAFKNLLIKQCQEAFEAYLGCDFVAPEGVDEEEEFELLLLHKKKMKGNLMFVACLAQAQILKPKILLIVLNSTLDTKKPLQLEALASFLPSCAPAVAKSKRAPEFFNYLDRCRQVVEDESIDRRVRYLLMDSIEEIDKMNLQAR